MPNNIHSILKQYWGHEKFRPLQEEIITSVINGKDTLALLPTGGGKSICFQIPALTKDGICIVISPLIALMKDQVANLKSRGIKAEALTSGMSKKAIDILLDNCIYGDIKFLYVSPERLKTEIFIARLKKMTVNFIAIDEAHCISQWGYDFRPAYLEIANIRNILTDTPVIALTATATPDVVDDIQDKLLFKEKNLLQKSFKRDNINYLVIKDEDKVGRMMKIIQNVGGSGIIYVLNRKKTQEIAHILKKRGISAEYYHAGITPEKRSIIQENWSNNTTQIIVATNAFGMGIDKPDVRFVINLDLPDSIEAYFQEAGRGGRDEKKAYAVLLINESDKENLTIRIENAFPSKEIIRKTYDKLCSYYRIAYGTGENNSYPFDLNIFNVNSGSKPLEVYNAMKFLEHAGYIQLSDAFYNPSRVKIEMNNMELYDFQIRNPKYDSYIKLLLRSYGGLFDSYSKIKEYELASRSKQTVSTIKGILRDLNKLEVITYEEQNDLPLLTLLLPRVQSKNLRINKEVYDTRKKIATNKMNAVINYAYSIDKCRSQILLSYFGEDSSECGNCDYCLAKNKEREMNSKEFQQLKKDILLVLDKQALDPKDLVLELLGKQNEKDIRRMVQWLLDNNDIKMNNLNQLIIGK